MRVAILDSAFALFSERGYAQTTRAPATRHAGEAVSSLQVRFDSKLGASMPCAAC